MAEQFALAALRHLQTAELLESSGRTDDAAYHYGLAGENAVKQTLVSSGIAAIPLPHHLRKHFDTQLHTAIANAAAAITALASGRLAADVQSGIFNQRFVGWSITIRYADTDYPVTAQNLAAWKADAVHLVNNGAF